MFDDQATEALVRAAAANDRSALERLLLRQLPGLEAFVRLRLGRELRRMLDAPDVVQSVCREVLQELDDFEFRGEAPFRHWLYVRAENKLRQKARHHAAQRRDARLDVSLADAGTAALGYATICSPSAELDKQEWMRRVEVAFDELPEEWREAVTLHKLCGMSHKEIAERMQKSEGAVRNLVYRGISRLALLVDPGGDGPRA
jgi:RNA polymerase sigma-70 factor, ECF subfamily